MSRSWSDEDLLPISALNHLLFCERRAALIHIEQIFVENRYTLEGTAGHRKAHAEPSRGELGATGKLVRHMWLRSEQLGLVGIADVVEFRPAVCRDAVPSAYSLKSIAFPPASSGVAYPIEYKRGRKRRWDNDDVQLCAQAMCLEEMLGVAVPAGAIFHIKSRRRREVDFDAALRAKTEQAAQRLHELVASGVTPPPVYKPRCNGCSLLQVCMPLILQEPATLRRYQSRIFVAEMDR